jgi:hypothetical protein
MLQKHSKRPVPAEEQGRNNRRRHNIRSVKHNTGSYYPKNDDVRLATTEATLNNVNG